MKKFLPFLLFALLSSSVSAQIIRFGNEYPIWSEYGLNNFQQTSDGGYILCTDAIPEMDTVTQLGKGYLVKLDAIGATQWIKSYPKTNSFIKCSDGNSVFQTSDGGYIIATAQYSSYFIRSIYLIKTDNAGTLQWSKLYPGMGSCFPTCVKQTSDLGYIVCGLTTDTLNNHSSAYLLKTDNAGNPQWGKSYVEAASGQSGTAYYVSQTSDGGYIVTGSSFSGVFVMKTDNAGTITWNNNAGTSGSDGLFCVKQTYDGGYIACGYGLFNTQIGFSLLKFDGAGNTQWKNIYVQPTSITSTSSTDESYSVEEVPGGYAVLGVHQMNCELLKTDVSGHIQWTSFYNSAQSMTPTSLHKTADGGYAFSSLWYTGLQQYADVAVIKTDSLGFTGCHDSTITLSDTAYTQLVNPGFIANNISPTIPVTTIFTNVTVFPITFCTSAKQNGIQDLSQENLLTIFPNPTSGNFSLQINSLTGNKIRIEIYDVLGQTVMEKKEENVSGNFQEQLDLSAVMNGIYFVCVRLDNGIVMTKKVVKSAD
jgi:hypothetical protein